MISTTNPRRAAVALGRLFLLTVLLSASAARAAPVAPDPVAEISRQYDLVTAIMRRPALSGVLVTEIAPESPAGAAGLQAGDVITSFYGKKIDSLQTLREQVADAIAHKEVEDAQGLAVLRVRRGSGGGGGGASEEVVIAVPREPLGLRAIEIEAGVPAERNPPPNPRGTLKLAWRELLDNVRAAADAAPPLDLLTAAAGPAATAPAPLPGTAAGIPGITLRLSEQGTARAHATADGEFWVGWMTLAGTPAGLSADDLLEARVAVATLANDDPPIETSYAFRLRLGDHETTPAFLLEHAEAEYYSNKNGHYVKAAATRQGETLLTEITTQGAPAPEKRTVAAPMNVLLQSATPFVAAALPQKPGETLALQLLSVRDFLPRPGYVLTTVGKKPLPGAAKNAPEQGWRVDLMHCGIVLESYFFTDSRKLIAIETKPLGTGGAGGGTTLIARYVADPRQAMAPVKKKPN